MKKRYIFTILVLSVIGGYVSSALGDQPKTDATDSPLVQEVAHQGEVLNNHEGRITNTEHDVSALQNKTSTAPSTERVVVHEVTQPSAPAPSPEPQPITVVSYQKIPVDNEGTDCKYVYSDGTTYQWHWQTVEYNQGTKITRTNGQCENSVIGQVKSS